MKLTIGMATYDDFDSTWFTCRALHLYHSEVMEDAEILVIDNSPHTEDGKCLRNYLKKLPSARYVAFDEVDGTAQPREQVFKHARGEYVLCMDSHVLVEAGAIQKLLDYYEDHPETKDLLTGPIVGDDFGIRGTNQEPEWRKEAYGIWAIDDRGRAASAPEFAIFQQGLGLFSCRREAWVGFNPDFRGFGGCETYICEKSRKQGGEVMCLPFLLWHHKFARPRGTGYRAVMQDKLTNYLIGFEELGLYDLMEEATQHFSRWIEPPERTPVNPRGCRHDAFETRVDILVHPNDTGDMYTGQILIKCKGCGLKFFLPQVPSDDFIMTPLDALGVGG